MTAVVSRLRAAALERRPEDRWTAAGLRQRPVATIALVLASVALHAVLMAIAALTFRDPKVPPPQEIAVEILQEPPKPPPSLAARPVPPPARAPKPKPVSDEAAKLKALKDQLASLKAERAALEKSEAGARRGQGPLAGSLQAIALPTTGAGDGEAFAYQDIVFSQLAKAKGIGQRQGQPGTAGVSFEIDAAGRLVSAAIVVPSGIPSLDREALDIVHRAAPFPVPPEGAQRTFVANVNFVAQPGP